MRRSGTTGLSVRWSQIAYTDAMSFSSRHCSPHRFRSCWPCPGHTPGGTNRADLAAWKSWRCAQRQQTGNPSSGRSPMEQNDCSGGRSDGRSYGPGRPLRLIVVTPDPVTLPHDTTKYLITNFRQSEQDALLDASCCLRHPRWRWRCCMPVDLELSRPTGKSNSIWVGPTVRRDQILLFGGIGVWSAQHSVFCTGGTNIHRTARVVHRRPPENWTVIE